MAELFIIESAALELAQIIREEVYFTVLVSKIGELYT